MRRNGTRGWAARAVTCAVGAAVLMAFVPALVQAATPLTAGAATSRAPRSSAASCPITDLCSTTLGGDAGTVKTANRQAWELTVTATNDTLMIEIARQASTSPVADELHSWSFPLKSGGLVFSAGTGVGTVKPGANTSPVATVDVKFKATGHKVVKGACTSGSETVYTGKLTGTVTLVTGLSGGGTVKATSFTAKLSAPTVTVYKLCVSPPGGCLPSSVTFDDAPGALGNPALYAQGITGTFSHKTEDQVTVSLQARLAKPNGAERNDESTVEEAPAKWTASTRTLVVKTTGTLITGSVTISGGTKSTYSEGCTVNGKRTHNLFTSYFDASWASPAGDRLTAHDKIGGNIVMPASNTAATLIVTSLS